MVNCTSPPPVEEPVEVGVAPPLDEPEAAAQEPREKAPAKYSTLFKMGLFFSVSYSLVPVFLPNPTRSQPAAGDPSSGPRHRGRQNQALEAEVASAVNHWRELVLNHSFVVL